MDQEINYAGRKFGFTKVLWEIKNYCIAPERLNRTFYSSKFYVRGFRLTKWRMVLTRSHISNENYIVSLYLQRLNCMSHNEEAFIDCVVEYHDHLGQRVEAKCQSSSKVNQAHHVHLKHASITPISEIHSDIFELTCEILVHFQGIVETVPLCENMGIKRLSEDLHNLYESGVEYDLTFKTSDYPVLVHKAIMFYRVTDQDLKNKITLNTELNVESFNFDTVDIVVRYLYSGNLNHAIRVPLVSVFKFAEYLDIKPIIAYYDPDKIAIFSTIEVEEYCETWTIEHFDNIKENIVVSPVMTNKNMDMKWRLKVYPKGFGKKERYVGIFIDIEAKVEKEICVEFSVEDESGSCVSYRNHKRIQSKEIFGDKSFINMDNVKNYMKNDSLTINLRLRMPTGEKNVSYGESVASYEHFPEQKNYDRFSKDILCLYQGKRFQNLCIELAKYTTRLYVHECILFGRSLTLHRMCLEKNLAAFYGINLTVIKDFFIFVYSGKLNEDVDVEDIFSLYQIAINLNITILKLLVVEKLTLSLNESNASNILKFAISENIESLIDSARNYIEESSH